jgi:EAL domain-containing protein (putative c-di-GMP-specific phosphodiesterase class I)
VSFHDKDMVSDAVRGARPGRARKTPCEGCRNGAVFPVDFSMAFQPIVDGRSGRPFAFEALVRGLDGASAAHILSAADDTNRYAFDQRCRVRAIELAASLGVHDRGAFVSINFMPNAIYQPEVCIRTTLETARRVAFPTRNIIFEFTEDQQIREPERVREILHAYRKMGFKTAIDDFGAGYAGLNLLADFQPDFIKLDMGLIRGIGHDPVRRAIVHGIVVVCDSLGIRVIAEGVETEAEFSALADLGIELFQGFLFARPAFEALPAGHLPVRDPA